jgi:PAS domain S-box-containing protein
MDAADESAHVIRLPPQPSSVSQARRLVRRVLAEAGRQDLVETAELLVSEVVTNALLHAGTPVDVRASLDDRGVRVEVRDGSRHLPVRRSYAPTAGTGRGLMLLDQMVDEWGVSREAEGKTVWFRMTDVRAPSPHPEPDRTAPGGQPRRTTSDVAIELRNMPLLLHGAWQEHAEALLREYLLANLDRGLDVDPIQVHAEATDAIAVLEEHVPVADVTVDPGRLMDHATEPRVSADVVEVPVPLESVPNFATLDRVIEDALEMARDGAVLTPPTQPEIREFRRWLCGQVLDQARGASPVPWALDPEPIAEERLDLEVDLERLRAADVATIVADETNCILAVSRPALDLLGYDDPSGLEGQRIVTVVPERFRQAHIAGFTLFLLVGRKPLIGRPVAVPALRCDGSEVLTEMTVSVESAGEGRSVFVATLRPL